MSLFLFLLREGVTGTSPDDPQGKPGHLPGQEGESQGLGPPEKVADALVTKDESWRVGAQSLAVANS